MEGDNKEHASDNESEAIAVRESTASDYNERTDEQEQGSLETAEAVGITLGVDDEEEDGDQSAQRCSEGRVIETVTLPTPNPEQTPACGVELMNITFDSVTFFVSGDAQEDQSMVLSSLAAFEVKDVKRESDGMKLVVGIPNQAKNGAVHELVEEIKTVLEEACSVAARQRKILASTYTEAVVQGDAGQTTDAAEEASKLEDTPSAEGVARPVSLSERRRAREARKLSQADSQQNASEAMSVARNPSRSESMANKAREALGRSGQDLPQIQEQLGEAMAGAALSSTVGSAQADHTGSLDTEKGIGLAVESEVPQRPQHSDATPGAFYTPGRAFGAPVARSDRSTEEHPTYEEAASPNRAPLAGNMDIFEVRPVVEAFKVDESATEEHVRQQILEETVEATVIDQQEVAKMRRYQRLVFILIVIVLAGIAIGLGVTLSTKPNKVLVTEAPSMASPAPSMSPTLTPRPTLEKVRSRATVRCGTSADVPALRSFNEETNQHEGFNVDLCQAIAAAVLGDANSINITLVSDASRFEALHNGSVDVLARATTRTMSREVVETSTGAGFSFSVPFLYSGLVFKGRPPFVKCAEELDTFFGICGQLKICVNKGSSLEEIMDRIFPSAFIERSETEFESIADGTCNVVATEPVYSDEKSFRSKGYQGILKSGTILFSREPLALVTRRNDPEWSDLVNAVLQALMAAEVQEVTQVTASSFRSSPELGNFREGMFSDAIAAVGNYGEIFDRHLDGIIARTGLNSLNLNGSSGLLYSFPFGVTEELGPEPIQGNTLHEILDRGYLRCGLSSNITGFAEFNASSQEWRGLDVSFCRVVASAVFADDFDVSHPLANTSILDQHVFETDALIEFVSLSDINQYVALAEEGRIDVLAGGMASLVHEVLEPTSLTGFSFSSPYFYGSPDGNLSDESTRSLVTRHDDSQWSTFVYWTLMCTIFAEEQVISRNKTRLMPIVNLFGEGFSQMFRAAVGVNGNYGDIYDSALEEHIPRAGRNQLNSNEHHGPQQYPHMFL